MIILNILTNPHLELPRMTMNNITAKKRSVKPKFYWLSTASYFLVRALARIIMRVFFSLQFDGLHYIQEQHGPVILAGNHTGWLDTLAVVTACNQRVYFLVAEWVTKWPILGPIIVALGGIPVRPGKGADALQEAVKYLKRGEIICIFPEGVLSVDGNLARFRNGVAKLHKDSGCPIIPFAIYGGYEAWPYNRPLPRLHKMAIHFGVPLFMPEAHVNEATHELEDMVGYMKASLERSHRSDKEREASFLNLLQGKSDVFSARPAVCMKLTGGWYELSYAELSRQAIRLSSFLIESGINPQDRIAILTESRPEFAVCFFGSLRAGATIVPLDVKLTSHELRSLLTDSSPRVLFISSHSVKVFEEIKDFLDSSMQVFLIDHDQTSQTYKSLHSLVSIKNSNSRERLVDDVALIIYTSGTTGSPKGVMTTIGNLIFQASQFEKIVNPKEGDRFLSVLPLNHLLELTDGFLGVLNAGGTIYYSHNLYPKDILGLMKEKKITGMIAVPLFYRALKMGIERSITKGSQIQNLWWSCATKLAAIFKQHNVRRFLFAPLHQMLGNKLRILISGGAPLEDSTAQFFDLIGIYILQGYGLTETSPVIASNAPFANRLGSVGQPIPGVEVKIDSNGSGDNEGEILTRGPHVMKGYYKRDDLTASVIDKEGWFHTGDIGKLDKDNYLYITGRIKNLIVLCGGKKVHPEEVETTLATSCNLKEMCVLGTVCEAGSKEGTEEVCAVLVPTDTFKNGFADHSQMEKTLIAEVQKLSLELAPYKRPTKVIVMDCELPKTATRKVKRNELLVLITAKH